ncbi:MAG: hypothetical protein KJ052_09465, partial [Candidatus Hydrogenedentes bacterium]|nr:hypothetical protein [Candidatus Hydrogenedentota bacterium]
VKGHPETAFWTSTEYDRSGYKQRADAATQALQNLIDTRGIDYIELNPHRDWAGVFDDRVDVYGRYLGLVFGGGECFNAAMVELELADVYLYEDGRYLVPELALKEFFSYTGAHRDSVENTLARLERFDFDGGLLEAITALAYAVGGVWSINHAGAVSFRVPERPDHVLFADPLVFSLEYGTADSDIVNTVGFKGNPLENGVEKTFVRSPSIAEYGPRLRGLPYYSLATSNDAERFVEGLLDDLAYPERVGEAVFPDGCADLHVGDMLEFRGAPFRRIARSVDGEWGGRFAGTLVARVAEVRHRLSGRLVQTTLSLTSPLRSVTHPLAYMTRSQAAESSLYEFRLDADAVGLDMGFHLT